MSFSSPEDYIINKAGPHLTLGSAAAQAPQTKTAISACLVSGAWAARTYHSAMSACLATESKDKR